MNIKKILSGALLTGLVLLNYQSQREVKPIELQSNGTPKITLEETLDRIYKKNTLSEKFEFMKNQGDHVIPDEVSAGGLKRVVLTCDSGLTAGSTFKGDITITYRKTGSSVDLTSTGSMTEPVV